MYQDAADIGDQDLLLRRITPSQHKSTLSGNVKVLTGFAFRERNHQCSMYVAKEVTREKVLSCGIPTQEIVELRAGDWRMRGYIIVRDPDECDDSHVFAQANETKSRGQIEKDCKAIAELVNGRSARDGI